MDVFRDFNNNESLNKKFWHSGQYVTPEQLGVKTGQVMGVAYTASSTGSQPATSFNASTILNK